MTRSELFAVMVGGLSTVAGSVLVGYALLGARLEYLLAASLMAAPGALLMAKLVFPAGSEVVPRGRWSETVRRRLRLRGGRRRGGDEPEGAASSAASGAAGDDAAAAPLDGDSTRDEEASGAEQRGATADVLKHRNVIDAAAAGASDGLHLALNVGAMLIAFIGLVALLNLLLGAVGGIFGADDLSFEQILGWVFAPLMFLVGVPWAEAVSAGSFLGQKVVLNEFVAFSSFGPVAETFSPKAQAVITFALTGFANLGSLAILLGGLGGIAPERRSDIAQLGLRAVLCGTLANLMSAAIAGLLIG